jgi:hypothetical protein
MHKSSIKCYYGTYQDALDAVGLKFRQSRMYSIQRSSEAKDHPWTLIYYGNFV